MPQEVTLKGAGEATIVSLVPFTLNETKPGLIPEFFEIPAAPRDGFSLFPVKVAQSRLYIDEDRGYMNYPILASQLAESICRDYVSSNLYVEPGRAEPGLFWIPGTYQPDQTSIVSQVHAKEIAAGKERQKQWFIRQVQAADESWGKYPGKHSLITDTQRFAAMDLGLAKEWLVKAQIEAALSKCPLCRTLVDPEAVICQNCGFVIDEEKYEKFKSRVTKTPAAGGK